MDWQTPVTIYAVESEGSLIRMVSQLDIAKAYAEMKVSTCSAEFTVTPVSVPSFDVAAICNLINGVFIGLDWKRDQSITFKARPLRVGCRITVVRDLHRGKNGRIIEYDAKRHAPFPWLVEFDGRAADALPHEGRYWFNSDEIRH